MTLLCATFVFTADAKAFARMRSWFDTTYQIRADVYGSPLIISTTKTRLVGAVESIIWNGREFIDSVDHGRELQSAITYDYFGECLNPTQGGSEEDGKGSTSTSVLMSMHVSGNRLVSTSKMAYWRKANAPYSAPPGFGEGCSNLCGIPENSKIPALCAPGGRYRRAQNQTDLSETELWQDISIGWRGIPNVIDFKLSAVVPEDHRYASFEIPTGYMAHEFNHFFTYDPVSQKLERVTNQVPESPGIVGYLPLVFSTPDHQYAMGIYGPQGPQFHPLTGSKDVPLFREPMYVRFDFNTGKYPTTKWSYFFDTIDTNLGRPNAPGGHTYV